MPSPPEKPSIDAGDKPLVTLAEIREAADRVRGIVVRTPLLPFGQPLAGDPRGRTRVWLKPENLQPIGAFKLRGAYNAIAQLPEPVRARGVVTASSGNHAQGVSRAARLLGIRAVIVMPVDAPRTKIAGVEADGAEIVFVGPASEERAERAAAIADTEGLALIPPYDHRHIIAGQGTCGLEIAEQITELQDAPTEATATTAGAFPPGTFTVLVPIGGGGLASGIATAVKAIRPDATVLGVEPELAADARDSLREGRIVRWSADDVARTSADGMRTMSLGRLPFRHLRRWLDGVLVVDEASIATAMLAAARQTRMVVEPSGATSLAAWLTHGEHLPAGPVVCVISGGNVDPARYRALLELAEDVEHADDAERAAGATSVLGATRIIGS